MAATQIQQAHVSTPTAPSQPCNSINHSISQAWQPTQSCALYWSGTSRVRGGTTSASNSRRTTTPGRTSPAAPAARPPLAAVVWVQSPEMDTPLVTRPTVTKPTASSFSIWPSPLPSTTSPQYTCATALTPTVQSSMVERMIIWKVSLLTVYPCLMVVATSLFPII